jgi:hypothetical protein
MKNVLYTLLTLLLIVNVSMAQNVGINATGAAPDASAGLDVNFTNRGFLPPRVSLTGPTDATTIPSPATGLIVYNTSTSGGLTPGLYFNRGTPASPYWATFEKTLWFKASATNGINNYTSTTWAVIPGTAITFTIPTGMTADVNIWAYAGAMETATNSNNYATVDIAIFRNGAFLPVGGFNRITLDGYNINEFKTTSFFTMETLGAGTYTYDIRGRRNGGTQAVNIGGNCSTDTNCGEIVIMVKFR